MSATVLLVLARRSVVGYLASRTACATLVDCDTRPIFVPVMIFRRRVLAFGTMPLVSGDSGSGISREVRGSMHCESLSSRFDMRGPSCQVVKTPELIVDPL